MAGIDHAKSDSETPQNGKTIFSLPRRTFKKHDKGAAVEKSAIGTIYLDALVDAPMGYPDPMGSLRVCLENIVKDVEDDNSGDERSSVLSYSSTSSGFSQPKLPSAAVLYINEFANLMLSSDTGKVGFVKSVEMTPGSFIFKYHYSRAFIRNPKSIMVRGTPEKRLVLNKTVGSMQEYGVYSVTITVTCV